LELSRLDDSTLDVKVVHTFRAHFGQQQPSAPPATVITQQPSSEAGEGPAPAAAQAAAQEPRPAEQEPLRASPPRGWLQAEAQQQQLLLRAASGQRTQLPDAALGPPGQRQPPGAAALGPHEPPHGPTMLAADPGLLAQPFAAAVASPFALAAAMPAFSVAGSGWRSAFEAVAPEPAFEVVNAETGRPLVAQSGLAAVPAPDQACLVEECAGVAPDHGLNCRGSGKGDGDGQLVPLVAPPPAAAPCTGAGGAAGTWRQPSVGVPLAGALVPGAARPRGEWELDPRQITVGRRLAVGGFGEVRRGGHWACCRTCRCRARLPGPGPAARCAELRWPAAPPQLDAPPQSPNPRQVFIGRYEGTVVAIKRLLHMDAAAVQRFANEIRLLARLRHPNLILFMGFVSCPLPAPLQTLRAAARWRTKNARSDQRARGGGARATPAWGTAPGRL
jgi:hypothetical protein